jgi:hypothetical protein
MLSMGGGLMTDTVNGAPIHEYVEKVERKEIRSERRISISETHKSLYGKSDKLRLGTLFDKAQQSGEVKQFSKKEIDHMNALNDLPTDERVLMQYLLYVGAIATKAEIVAGFKSTEYWSGESANGIKASIEKLARLGMMECISIDNKSQCIPYKRGLKAYYRLVDPDKFEQPTPAGEENQVPAKPAQEESKLQEAARSVDDVVPCIRTALVEWMDFHNVYELSIHIKKRD